MHFIVLYMSKILYYEHSAEMQEQVHVPGATVPVLPMRAPIPVPIMDAKMNPENLLRVPPRMMSPEACSSAADKRCANSAIYT